MIERPASKQPIPPHAKKVFSGVIFDVYQWEQKLFDGTSTTFEKIRRPDTILVIPTFSDGTFLIEEEEQPNSQPMITFPAGRMEYGEDPEAGALRELLEETGCEPEKLILWKSLQPSSLIDWAIYVFIAQGCHKVAEQDLDPGEKILTRKVTMDELLLLLENPAFQNDQIAVELMEAKYDLSARAKLEKLLFG